jgi:hypothetical protein
LLESPFEKSTGGGGGSGGGGASRAGTAHMGLGSTTQSMDSVGSQERHISPQKASKLKAAAHAAGAVSSGGKPPRSKNGRNAMRFVNTGTHQVALFEGNPPRDLLKSANPMAWLAAQLNPDLLMSARPAGAGAAGAGAGAVAEKKSGGGLCAGNKTSAVDSAFSHVHIVLSPGASAIVNISHPRLKAFCTESISRDPDAVINDDALSKLLKVKSLKVQQGVRASTIDVVKYNTMYRKFQFDPHLHEHERTFRQAIPENVFIDTLWAEVNDKFVQLVGETEEQS